MIGMINRKKDHIVLTKGGRGSSKSNINVQLNFFAQTRTTKKSKYFNLKNISIISY